ncbi:MAG: hypothetical protein ABIS23_06540 [Sphingomicrobium sp.]
MRDEIFDRDYQAGREALNDGIDRIARAFGDVFRATARVQFAAPWKRTRRDHC